MSFISPEYVIFFAVVLPAFFALRHRYRWLLLLIVSYFFYAYGNLQYLPLILLSTGVDYIAARRIGASERMGTRRLWLAFSIGANLSVLFFFKYFNFAVDAGAPFFAAIGLDAGGIGHDLVLPIGISFYTFQSMAYTIDVYRGKIAPEKHVGIVATYIAFFPQLVAGPIERATNLLPQFRQKHRFDIDEAVAGFQQILWGAFKKVVIADRLAIYVNTVYNDVDSHSGLTLILATIFFGIQIYCDFSGYSDIAIGTARVLGFRLMDNFRQPYLAQSVREFWARWHISLSTWFRDYVYIPLGGNRVSLVRNLFNLVLVFTISGLWHGAGWTFILWGLLHGLAVAGQAALRRAGFDGVPGRHWTAWLLRVGLTFAFVQFTWIFFRSNSLDDALYVIGHLFNWTPGVDLTAPFAAGLLGAPAEFGLSLALIGLLFAVDAVLARQSIEGAAARLPLVLRWGVYYALTGAIVFSGLYATGAQKFIYFQF